MTGLPRSTGVTIDNPPPVRSVSHEEILEKIAENSEDISGLKEGQDQLTSRVARLEMRILGAAFLGSILAEAGKTLLESL